MLISDLENKKILILGLGEEGLDNLCFVQEKIEYKELGIADITPFEQIKEKTKERLKNNIKLYFGEDYLSSVGDYDIIIKSPGVPLHKIKFKKNQIVTSQSDIFIKNCKGRIVGVTGTKGKSTTSLMIHHILKKKGYNSFLIGNIGVPVLGYLGEEKEEDIFIYELSSFQLQTITNSPHIAVVLNLFKDHLDRHKDFEEYFLSKKKIVDFQNSNDLVIYNQNNVFSRKIGESSLAKKISFSGKEKIKGVATPLDPIFEVITAIGVEKKEVHQLLLDFKGLPHRMEYVSTVDEVIFYNDSAATIPEATAKAVKELSIVGTLIIGGKEKGSDIFAIIESIEENKVENIIVFNGSSKELGEAVMKTGRNVFTAANMEEAVRYGKEKTEKGKICLLSPGFASFGMFRDYKERGDLFKKYAKK
ncbi:MAG: UDP-N-acetylmuramoyl-L-alanine--D-glutamate ligase [Patescibacteria group bacterium]|nr:UDP-N-acetylmuramoyl-L-alanine--D-glutamate ligase [Patescibacteria group bacterium]